MRLTLVLAAILSLAVCSPALAETITYNLAELIANDSYIISGDKKFEDFAYSYTANMPSAEAVTLYNIIDEEGNYGIAFQGGFVDLLPAEGGATGGSVATVTFRVSVLDPNQQISDVHLSGNPIVVGDAALEVSVMFPEDAPDEYLEIHHILPGGQKKRTDSLVFDDLYDTLLVKQSILAYAQSESSVATISDIRLSFSQVPEPSTMITLALGLALFGCFVGRNRR